MNTLVDLLHDRVQAQPEKIIYQFWQNGGITEQMSFSNLDRRARATAAYLQNAAPASEKVLLVFPQSLDPMVGFFACLYTGMVAVPIPVPFIGSVANRLAVLKRYLDDAGSKTILTVAAVSSVLQPGAEEAGLGQVHWINIEDVDPATAEGWKNPIVTVDMPALMLYTSGSTQLPRGIIASQGNLAASLEATTAPFKNMHELIVSWTPLQSAMGLLVTIQVLGFDATQLYFAPQNFIQKPITWLRLISDYHATRSIGATFAYRLCVDGIKPEERAGLDLSSWKQAMSGGEPVRLEVLNQFARVYEPYGFSSKAFMPAYGSSEIMGGTQPEFDRGLQIIWASSEALEHSQLAEVSADSVEAKPFVSCGKPLPSYCMIIVDPDTCQPCSPDEIGEIWVAGPAVAQGYWNKPKETAEIFNAHLANGEGPYLRTGDLGFLKDGELYITSRLKDVIIVNGRNLLAADFEAAVAGVHPALQPGAAAAFGVRIGHEEKVVIIHETRPGQEEVEVEEVASRVRQTVSEKLNVPVHAVVLIKPGSLPRTGSGKIQRYLCRSRYLESLSDETQKKA